MQPSPDSEGYVPEELQNGTPHDRGFSGDTPASRLAEDLDRMF